jgi:hypothetical protein
MNTIIKWLFPPDMRDLRKSWLSWVAACVIWALAIGAWFAVPMLWRAAVCSVAVCS